MPFENVATIEECLEIITEIGDLLLFVPASVVVDGAVQVPSGEDLADQPGVKERWMFLDQQPSAAIVQQVTASRTPFAHVYVCNDADDGHTEAEIEEGTNYIWCSLLRGGDEGLRLIGKIDPATRGRPVLRLEVR